MFKVANKLNFEILIPSMQNFQQNSDHKMTNFTLAFKKNSTHRDNNFGSKNLRLLSYYCNIQYIYCINDSKNTQKLGPLKLFKLTFRQFIPC